MSTTQNFQLSRPKSQREEAGAAVSNQPGSERTDFLVVDQSRPVRIAASRPRAPALLHGRRGMSSLHRSRCDSVGIVKMCAFASGRAQREVYERHTLFGVPFDGGSDKTEEKASVRGQIRCVQFSPSATCSNWSVLNYYLLSFWRRTWFIKSCNMSSK